MPVSSKTSALFGLCTHVFRFKFITLLANIYKHHINKLCSTPSTSKHSTHHLLHIVTCGGRGRPSGQTNKLTNAWTFHVCVHSQIEFWFTLRTLLLETSIRVTDLSVFLYGSQTSMPCVPPPMPLCPRACMDPQCHVFLHQIAVTRNQSCRQNLQGLCSSLKTLNN